MSQAMQYGGDWPSDDHSSINPTNNAPSDAVANDIVREDSEPEWHSALKMWLRWHEAYQQATANLYKLGFEGAKAEELLDEVEQLRHAAVAS